MSLKITKSAEMISQSQNAGREAGRGGAVGVGVGGTQNQEAKAAEIISDNQTAEGEGGGRGYGGGVTQNQKAAVRLSKSECRKGEVGGWGWRGGGGGL